MSLFDIGLGFLAFVGAVSIAIGVVAWHEYQDFRG
jgi:hypothetical protein